MMLSAGEEVASEKNTVVLKLQINCKRIDGDMENDKGMFRPIKAARMTHLVEQCFL